MSPWYVSLAWTLIPVIACMAAGAGLHALWVRERDLGDPWDDDCDYVWPGWGG